MMMRYKLKIYKTIWVNALVIFLAVYAFLIISELLQSDQSLRDILIIGFVGSLFTIFGYGIMFWTGFLVAILILDLVLIKRPEPNLTVKLLIEWGLISCPLIYFAFKYDAWVFLVAVSAFLLSQLYWRRKKINQIIKFDTRTQA